MNVLNNRATRKRHNLNTKRGVRSRVLRFSSPLHTVFILTLVLCMGTLLFVSNKLIVIDNEFNPAEHSSSSSSSLKGPPPTVSNVHQDFNFKHRNETKKKKEKPKLILHVGPRKTATTTIQLSVLAMRNSDFSKYLAEDDYEIVYNSWPDMIAIIEQCFLQLPGNCTMTGWDMLTSQLDVIHNKNKNAVITNEALSLVPKTPDED
ncbi:MAG: hypothetical protein ACI90V_002197 [Bacillariaceae sp.]|jgi:hypothetical protein